MEALSGSGAFKQALIILGAAAVIIPLLHRLRVSPVLGFMLVGVLVGPFGFGRVGQLVPPLAPWLRLVSIDDPQAIEPIARLGVAMLLFMIGLELSFERLWLMRRLVFGLGVAQLAGCAAVLAGAAALAGAGHAAAAVLGLAAAMSSTAVVLQVLGEQKQLGTEVGRASFAILLFQDLAVVPVLFTLGLAAPRADEAATLAGLGFALAQAGLAVAALVVFGRMALRPLFRSVARTRSPELFMAASLLVVIAAAVATASAGLSMALGALIGGLLLAGTEYRREIEVTIDPFKGLLLGVFLISIGLGLNLGQAAAHPLWLAGILAAVLTAKLAIVTVLSRAFGLPWHAGVQAGLILAPGGEFSFVILAVSVADGFLSPALADQAVIAAALTMIATPLLAHVGERLARHAERRRGIDPALLPPHPDPATPLVLIAGFGRVGQTVAAMLETHGIAYCAIDSDADGVARHRAAGRPVFYGDMTRTPLLRRLDLATARALVVTIDAVAASDALVAAARAERADLLIVARARDAGHAAHLYRVGASDAVPETVEASLQLSEAVLVDLGVPMGPVIASIHEKRAEFQATIRAMAPEADVRPLGRRRMRDAIRRTQGTP